MSTDELEQVLEVLSRRPAFNDTVFVLVLERRDGEVQLLDYGMREIGDIAAWIAVEKQQKNTEGEQKA